MLRIETECSTRSRISILHHPPPPRLMDYLTRGGGQNINAGEGGGVLRNALLWIRHSFCSHDLTEAVATCIRLTEKIKPAKIMA